jgi:hypothetical protein
MKTFNDCAVIIACCAALILSGCEHKIAIESVVHPDGSLDRTIMLHNTDSNKIEKNFLGISAASGWDVTVQPLPKRPTEKIKHPEVNITFKRHFASVEDARNDTLQNSDSVFQIASTFEKKNRWFYTYVEYTDTYRALNKFNAIPKEHYFTKEDFAFIERLPAEGTAISKADSLYLARLNEKIFDHYGTRTIFEELFQHVVGVVRQYQIGSVWLDTLSKKKEEMYQRFAQGVNGQDGDFLSVVESFGIPLPAVAKESVQGKTADVERRLEFMSEAYSGKYIHSISMPWAVVESNADSVVNNRLFWRPPVVKFLLSDYSMTATARRMNILPVAVSAVVVFLTIGLFLYRKKGI